jgi:hypothetical protein
MPLAEFTAAVKRAGCVAEVNYIAKLGDYDVTIDAPDGFLFRGNDSHSLVHHTLTGDTEAERARIRAEAVADMLAALPLERCTDPECTTCVRERHNA